MIKAEFDMPKLRRSLTKAAKNFGDTNKQAVARWGVQTCRELAVSTQAYGRSGTRKIQINAIEAGVNSTICTVTEKQFQAMQTGRARRAKIRGRWVDVASDRLLASEGACHDWINEHRGSNGRARRLSQNQIAVAPRNVVQAVIKTRKALAGIAKEGWLDAGQEIAKRQKGTDKISIGKNFLGYAQRPQTRGGARASGDDYKPFATLSNFMRHTRSAHVLTEGEKRKSIGFGLRKTITWYRRAAKRALDKA